MSFQINLEISGNLREHSLPELLAEIARAKLNGSLRLANAGGQKSVVYFDAGETVFAVSNARRFRLSELLRSENKITEKQISELADATGDLALREKLIASNVVPTAEIDRLVSRQIEIILKNAFEWRSLSDEWIFSPLARVKGDVRFQTNAPALLVEHARNLPDDAIAFALRDSRETFSAKPLNHTARVNLTAEEAFVFSRFESNALDVQEAAMFSGLPAAAALRAVYTLWLAGFLARADWDAPFSARALEAIASANLTLKKREAAAPDVSETKIKTTPTVAAAAAERDSPAPESPPSRKELTLDEYLERVERAASFYAVFDTPVEATAAAIKGAYLALAKRFHPDLFQREVGAERFKQIQAAFAKIAQAYETLKNERSRELYDFKMRKQLAEAKTAETIAPTTSGEERGSQARATRAAEDFRRGFNFVMDENFADALPFLARAVHLAEENARYRAYYGKALAAASGQKHKAEAEMQAAIRLEPDNADYRLMLAEFFASVNLPKRAEGELNRLLAIFPDNNDAKLMLDSLTQKR